MTEPRQRYSVSPAKPTKLPSGPPPPPPPGPTYINMNGEPLSTKQLHEIITAQNMTIDRLLVDKSHYMEVVRKLYDVIKTCERLID